VSTYAQRLWTYRLRGRYAFCSCSRPTGYQRRRGPARLRCTVPAQSLSFFFFPFFPLSRHVSRQPSDPAHSLALGGHIREPVGDVPELHRGSAWATHEPGQPACPLFSWMTRGTLRMHHRARRETGSGQCGRARCEACSQRPLVGTPFVSVSTHRAIIPAELILPLVKVPTEYRLHHAAISLVCI
jgi:hypothetical protein